MNNETFEQELAKHLKRVMMEDTFLLSPLTLTSRMVEIITEFQRWNPSFFSAEKLNQLLNVLNTTNFPLDKDDIATIIIPSNLAQTNTEFLTSPADLMSSCAIFRFRRTTDNSGYCCEFHYYQFDPGYIDKRVDVINNGALVSADIKFGQIPVSLNFFDRNY